jgi:2-C-methyl-D-erythritol 4-phosphate cytidylyltransferase
MTSAIIVAAGRGTRMGPNTDKLFLEVSGAPVVAHAWERMDEVESIDEIVIVIRDGMKGDFQELAKTLELQKPYRFVTGGKERQDSVWNGLQGISASASIVAIQDGARPCTSAELIEATIDAARGTGAAVAAQRVTDTIKQSDDGRFVARHLDRSRLWAVQTPQTFRVEVIRKALSAVREKGLLVTDDTAACELIGQPVRLVESVKPNPKVTVPADLHYIELLLR